MGKRKKLQSLGGEPGYKILLFCSCWEQGCGSDSGGGGASDFHFRDRSDTAQGTIGNTFILGWRLKCVMLG